VTSDQQDLDLRDVGCRRKVLTNKGDIMRIAHYFSVWLLGFFSAVAFVGCADQQNAASANGNSSANSYSSNDLQKTGKRTSGEALQAADPSVTATTGH
jgi:hypothetical protein